jgi:hypothetical protein
MWSKHLFFGILFATVALSTVGAKEPAEESSKEQSGFSAEQLVAGALSYFPIGTFDSLSDYGRDKDATAILANCWARAGIEGQGAVSGNSAQCFLADAKHSLKFLSDVERIADLAVIQLASVDDKYQGSNLYFRVFLTRDGEKNQVEYFANWGHDAEKYGYAYQAPQKLYRWPTLLKKVPCGSSRVISLITIGADSGVRDDVEIEVVSGNPSTECLNAIEGYLLESQFIPGREGKKLIEARHMALWGNWKRPKMSNRRRADAPNYDPKASGER